VTGSVELTDSSLFLVDASFRVTGAAGDGGDLITATGAGAIDGVVTPTLLSLERALPLVIIDPTTSSADNGAVVTDTVVIDYSIGLDGATGDGTTIDLLADVDFSIGGMTRNQRRAGDHINDILTGDGSESLGALFAFIGNQTDPDVVIDTIDRLTTQGYAANLLDTLYASDSFVDSLIDCERLTDEGLEVPDGACYWLKGSWRLYKGRSSFEYKQFKSDSWQVAGGFQSPITWVLAQSEEGGWLIVEEHRASRP
jgi:hypothetical protein